MLRIALGVLTTLFALTTPTLAAPILLGGGTFAFSGDATSFDPSTTLPTTAPLFLRYTGVPGEPCGACGFTIGLGDTGTWDIEPVETAFAARVTNAADEVLTLHTLIGGSGNLESLWFGSGSRADWDVEVIRFIVTSHVFTVLDVPGAVSYSHEIAGEWQLWDNIGTVPEPSVLLLAVVAIGVWRGRHGALRTFARLTRP